MRLRTSLLTMAVLAVAIPAGASVTADEPYVPNTRLERVYFHCEGATKAHNTVSDGAVPWNATAPTQSVQQGAGCGSHDNPLRGNNQVSVQDSHFEGTFTGNLDTLSMELHNIYLGPGRQSGKLGFNVRLLVDGAARLGDAGREVIADVVRSSSGASEKVTLTVTGLDLLEQEEDAEHTVLLTLSGGAFVANGQAFPVHDTMSAWVYDTTEVPSGLTFNPTAPEALTVKAAPKPPVEPEE